MRLFVFITVILLALGAGSCSKSSCWSCDINAAGVKYTETLCDKSKKEIADLQGKPQETKNKDGEVIYVTTYSNCVQK